MRKIGDGEMSDSHKVETMEAPQIADVLQAASDALDWYDSMGPAEARAKVTADRDALLCMLNLGGFDIGTATKH